MLGKIEGKKRAAEDEMVGWYCRFSGQEFEQTPGDSEGEKCLVCCSPWGCRVGYNLAIEQQQIMISTGTRCPDHQEIPRQIPEGAET